MRRITALLVAVMLMIGLGAYGLMTFGSAGAAQELTRIQAPSKSTISVAGWGEAKGEPDVAVVSLGVESEGVSAGEAQAENNRAMEAVIASLSQLKIPNEHIKTEFFSLHPDRRYDKETGGETVVGYRAVNQVVVTVMEIDQLGQVIDAAISAGANRVNSVQHGLQQEGALLDAALEAAVADAQRKAEVIARAAGVEVVRILTLSEPGTNQTSYRDGLMYAKAESLGGGVPVQPGQVSVKAGVEVVFEVTPVE